MLQPLYPFGYGPSIHWMGPRAGLHVVEETSIFPVGIQTPAVQPVAHTDYSELSISGTSKECEASQP
jgi:hypothetical protein